MRRLGLLVVGDEILAGHTRDSNTHWLAQRLKQMGIRLVRVEVCSDALADIEESVRRFLQALHLDYVITSGGLGPTHDDRTMEGVARALGVPLLMREEDHEWLRQRVAYGHKLGYFQSPEPNAGLLKMALLPAGSEAMPNHIGTCLGAIAKHADVTLFTLPGVPAEFQRMFEEAVRPLLETADAEHVAEVVLYTEESRFYETLMAVEKRHGVQIGSYPRHGHIVLRATGDKQAVQAAVAELRAAGKEYLGARDTPR